MCTLSSAQFEPQSSWPFSFKLKFKLSTSGALWAGLHSRRVHIRLGPWVCTRARPRAARGCCQLAVQSQARHGRPSRIAKPRGSDGGGGLAVVLSRRRICIVCWNRSQRCDTIALEPPAPPPCTQPCAEPNLHAGTPSRSTKPPGTARTPLGTLFTMSLSSTTSSSSHCP